MAAGGEGVRCGNCGEAAGPRFCPRCGQEVEARHGPLLAVTRDALSDWLSLDSRLARSLRALARPGGLSELYLGGKRAPFLRPFRLYLLASLILFSTLLTFEPPDASEINLYIGGELVGVEAEGSVQRDLEFWQDTSPIDRWILELQRDRLERLRALPKQEILDILFAGFRRMLPATLVAFVPFLALGLKLLYIRGRCEHTLYIDHLVFSLHFQTALFFALSAAWLIARLAGLELVPSAISYVATGLAMLAIYLPLALRRFYRQSRAWTAVKTLALVFVYFQLLSVVLVLSQTVAIWRV